MEFDSTRFEVPAALDEAQDWFEAKGLTDGLPVVPPTPQLVEKMIAASGLEADAPVATIFPSAAVASVEKIAINAVMAGSRPQYMPVILACVRAIGRSEFNLAALQATTHPVAPLVVVNGPVRNLIGINCGANVFGQGFRANATIGRTLRLLMCNIGEGLPGKSDMSTQGSPAKFSFCAGENEEASPWEPLHVERGFGREESTVFLHGGEAPHNIQDHASANAKELLTTIASTIVTLGSNNMGHGGELLLALGPEHARILARDGLSKQDVRMELHRRMRLRFDSMGPALRDFYRLRRPTFDVGPEIEEIAFFDDPSQIMVMVTGGAGLHSTVIPGFGGATRAVMERVENP
jgi:hypothetical protein